MYNDDDGVDRRHVLERTPCLYRGVRRKYDFSAYKAFGLLSEAEAATAANSFTFLQISDSHVGFDKKANPNALGTLQEAIAKVKALPNKPAFMLHTGDITHLSKSKEFDDAAQVIGSVGLDVHYVPGEHDNLDEVPLKSYLERYGKNTKGTGWYSFDQRGIHFIGLNNVMNLKAGGMGMLGAEQLAWLADDVKRLSDSTPIVVFAHIPLWTISKEWGWGTEDFEQALSMLKKRFGDGAQWPYSSIDAENRRQRHLPHREVDGLSAAGAGHRSRAAAIGRSGRKARSVLGIRTVVYTQGQKLLAVTDQPSAESSANVGSPVHQFFKSLLRNLCAGGAAAVSSPLGPSCLPNRRFGALVTRRLHQKARPAVAVRIEFSNFSTHATNRPGDCAPN